jgi:hypothetical protein
VLKKVLKNSDFRVFPETVKKWGTRFRHILGLGRVLFFGPFWGSRLDPHLTGTCQVLVARAGIWARRAQKVVQKVAQKWPKKGAQKVPKKGSKSGPKKGSKSPIFFGVFLGAHKTWKTAQKVSQKMAENA